MTGRPRSPSQPLVRDELWRIWNTFPITAGGTAMMVPTAVIALVFQRWAVFALAAFALLVGHWFLRKAWRNPSFQPWCKRDGNDL
jgi:hypothetical protein